MGKGFLSSVDHRSLSVSEITFINVEVSVFRKTRRNIVQGSY